MLERLLGRSLARPAPVGSRIVMSLPPAWGDEVERRAPAVTRTAATLAELFAGAKRSLRIFAPYVDPTFTGLVAVARAPVRVVTTPAPGRPPRPNPVLERCSTTCDLAVRYLNERRDRALIFQMHAKMVLADGERAYVGSANLTDTSVHYNLELGLLIDDRETIGTLERVFDYFFDSAAVRAGNL
jgi:phosphatidylserine/phosphatidylglycerophosphate/cardiolipin synthase-like enzyme